MILDNLGISSTRLREELKNTSDWGEAVGNIIQEEMASAGEEVDTTAESFVQLSVRMQNLKAEIGEKLTPVFVTLLDTINNILTALTKVSDWQPKGFWENAKAILGMANPYTAASSFFLNTLDPSKLGPGTNETPTFAPSTLSDGDASASESKAVKRTTTNINKIRSVYLQMIYDLWRPLAEKGIKPEEGGLIKKVIGSDSEFNNINDQLMSVGSTVTSVFQQFASAFTSGKNAMAQFLDFFKKWAVQMIAQLAAITVLALVLNAVLPGASIAKIGAGRGFKDIFSALFGGTGMGGFLGNIGDLVGGRSGYAIGTPYVPRTGLAMVHQGEAIIPKNRNGGQLIAVVKGRDLHFIMSEFDRTRGVDV
jgi:hypothetical protein